MLTLNWYVFNMIMTMKNVSGEQQWHEISLLIMVLCRRIWGLHGGDICYWVLSGTPCINLFLEEVVPLRRVYMVLCLSACPMSPLFLWIFCLIPLSNTCSFVRPARNVNREIFLHCQEGFCVGKFGPVVNQAVLDNRPLRKHFRRSRLCYKRQALLKI